MAAFPAYAQLLYPGYAENLESVVDRSTHDTGAPLQRPRATRAMVTRPVAYALDSLADYQAFMVWYAVDIRHGTDWFDWTDPLGNQVKQARIVVGSFQPTVALESSLTHWTVRFELETWR